MSAAPVNGTGVNGHAIGIDKIADTIPVELLGLDRWGLWRRRERDGKQKKIPYQARPGKCRQDGRHDGWPFTSIEAKTNDPSMWGPFTAAYNAYNHCLSSRSPADGPGFLFVRSDGLVGIDLDNCIGPDGEILDWVKPFLAMLAGSYAEISPSGTGIKVWVRGTLPNGDDGLRRGGFGPDGTGAVEIYCHGRYFTVTGNSLDPNIKTVEPRQEAIDAIYAEVKTAPEPNGEMTTGLGVAAAPVAPPAVPDLSDTALLGKARRAKNGEKFAALYDRGDTAGYASGSEAHFALCCMLAFWAGKSAERIERLFSASALAGHEKWQREDYRQRTIGNAIESTDTVYEPKARPPKAGTAINGKPGTAGKFLGPRPEGYPWPPTDTGNGERLVHYHGKNIRYIHPWDKFLAYDGTRWAIDNTAAVDRMAKDTVRRIYLEAAHPSLDKSEREEMAEWALGSESHARRSAMLKCAAAEAGIPALPEHLDRDPWALNCLNGTIDLKQGKLRPHRREDMITCLCPVKFEPKEECPTWEATVKHVLGGKSDLITFFHRLCGVVLTGTVIEQILPILYGSGANGKSTILGVLMDMMGPDYAMKAMPDLLMAKKNPTHPTDRADLFGKRLVVAIETADGARIDETLIKELTGSDKIRARRMREDPWEFKPTHKLMLCTNHKPVVRGTDHAIWRRLKLVPFDVTIPDDKQDKKLPEKLLKELPGILAWCVRGCLDWQEHGLAAPKEVTEATAKYRKEEDMLGTFLDEYCVLGDDLKVKSSVLYQQYKAWTEEAGVYFLNPTRFGKSMTERNYEKLNSNGTYYLGIGLRSKTDGE